MKKLKLMALGLMFLMVQSAVAVTLPSSSYAPSQYESSYSESSVVFSSGSTVSGSFLSLGGYSGECTGKAPGTGSDCETCCTTNYNVETCMGGDYSKYSECAALYQTCYDACMQGPSLPLDGGLSILLALALGSGAVRVFRKK